MIQALICPRGQGSLKGILPNEVVKPGQNAKVPKLPNDVKKRSCLGKIPRFFPWFGF